MLETLKLSENFYQQYLNPIAKTVEKYLLNEVNIQQELKTMYIKAVTGGMRFRPILQYLGYLVAQGETPEILTPYAASLEILHKASLIHDDLIDQDTHRRGEVSFYSCFGPEAAIAIGDYLVALSLKVLFHAQPPREYWQRFILMHELLCEGELLEVCCLGQEIDIFAAQKISQGKTASLIQFSLSSGALLAGAPPKIQTALDEYGLKLGMVFQTINDLNNLTGLDKLVKGAALTDLKKRRSSVPLAMLDQKIKATEGQSLWAKLDTLEDQELVFFISSLQKSAQQGELQEEVTVFCHKEMQAARNSLLELPPSKIRNILAAVSEEIFSSWFWRPEKGRENSAI